MASPARETDEKMGKKEGKKEIANSWAESSRVFSLLSMPGEKIVLGFLLIHFRVLYFFFEAFLNSVHVLNFFSICTSKYLDVFSTILGRVIVLLPFAFRSIPFPAPLEGNFMLITLIAPFDQTQSKEKSPTHAHSTHTLIQRCSFSPRQTRTKQVQKKI